jgi:hypothetical protein
MMCARVHEWGGGGGKGVMDRGKGWKTEEKKREY